MPISNVLVGVAAVYWGGLGGTPLGFTTDGVTMTVSTETTDIRVDQLHGPIKRVMISQDVRVTLNMAEASLDNLEIAIPGSVGGPAGTLTLGGSDYQEDILVLVGESPTAGIPRTITLTAVNPVGEVGMPYKKGEITIVPITFAALANDSDVFGTIVDG